MLLEEKLNTNKDIDVVIPYFEDLINGDSAEALKSLKNMADIGNLFASYVLGSFFLFGATPRFYDFNTSYEVGVVRRNARIDPNEAFGLSCLLKLLKIKEGDIPLYQLECIWDLYKIICGDTEFFKNNDITCRPLNGAGALGPLFKNGQAIKNLLVKLEHHEIFLDEAKSLLVDFENSGDNSFLDRAVRYLESILNERETYKFSMHDISQANLMMARIYASGSGHMKKNLSEAMRHYEVARLDEGFVELISLIKLQGLKYQKFIKKFIGLIKDRSLKIKLYEENGMEAPIAPDVSSVLKRLINTKPASCTELNFSFDFNSIDTAKEDNSKNQSELPDQIRQPTFAENTLSEAEIFRIKERSRLEALVVLDLSDSDEVDDDSETSFVDEPEPENDDDMGDDLSFIEVYPEYDSDDQDYMDD